MHRRILVVGDPPVPGGHVLPYSGPEFTIHGHRVALIGGRAYCEGCNSIGIIAKAGGPRRNGFYGAEVALEGDVVVCHCPVPPLILSTLQTTSYVDDLGGGSREFDVNIAGSDWYALNHQEQAASKKIVDDFVDHPPEAEPTENICPNMTNKEFATLAMKLRDMALDHITKKRLPELDRWDKPAQARVKLWFGVADQGTRDHLQKGLTSCARVLQGLEPKNFVRYIGGGKLATCVLEADRGTAAAACKPDTATHTIAIALEFCSFRYDNRVNFDTGEALDGDSRLLTLVHEVTHFDDTFGSFDHWYGTRNSRAHAKESKSQMNADSLASYILGVVGD